MQPEIAPSPRAVVVDGDVVVGALVAALLQRERVPVEAHDAPRLARDDPRAVGAVRVPLCVGRALKSHSWVTEELHDTTND